MFLIFFSDIISYGDSRTKYNAIIYLLIANFLVYLGFYFGKRIVISKHSHKRLDELERINPNRRIIAFINMVAIIGIIGAILFAIELLLFEKINIFNPAIVRDVFTTREVTNFSRIASILSFGSLVSLSTAIIMWKTIGVKQKMLWLLAPISYSGFSVLSAGRQAVFQILIIMIASIAISRNNVLAKNIFTKKSKKRNKYKFKIIIVLVILLIISYGFSIASNRNDNLLSQNKKEVLQMYFNFKISPDFDHFLNSLPNFLRDGLTESLIYFTHEIPQFTIIWDIPQIGPFYGLYSTPFIDRRLYSLGLTKYSVEYKMSYVRGFMKSSGSMPVGWKTMFSFLIIDFGVTMSLIVSFIIGFFSGKVYQSYKKRKTLFSSLLLIIVNVGMVYSIMWPATSDTILLFMYIFCVFMFILETYNSKWYFNIN